ncbi:MAG: helix-turn-helix domain-containing protein, partial [Acetobacteraceae bacterium]
VRIIAATHHDLQSLVRRNLFREDLFYRLNVVPLRLPPLRERTEDIPVLARHFLTLAKRDGLPAKRLDPDAMEQLQRHHWPGNVRELENLMRRVAVLHPGEAITGEAIAGELGRIHGTLAPAPRGAASERLVEMLECHFRALVAAADEGGIYQRALAEFERPLIRTALAATRGNQIRAAMLLGLNRNTLRKKIRDLAIPVLRGTG